MWLEPSTWVSLATLCALEIVLGIDNIVFISILAGKLPAAQQDRARTAGLGLALGTRLLLLLSISWIMKITAPLFTVFQVEFSGRALILLAGGLFLVAKSTGEIYESLELEPHAQEGREVKSFAMLLAQIALLDVVFSFDSVITAVGMVDQISIMAVAMVVAVGVMMAFAGPIGRFVLRHPSMKVLALSFLILVGFTLILESVGQHVNKGYIYFAMAFSLGIEFVNMRMRKRKHDPLVLHGQR
jgi:predicted tellurium resistance membrane protein TerC